MTTQSQSSRLELLTDERQSWARCRQAVLDTADVLPRGRADLRVRWPFDEISRDVTGEKSRFRNVFVLTEMLGDVLNAGRASGDAKVYEAARTSVNNALVAIAREVWRGHDDPPVVPCRATAVANFVEELSEAAVAVTRFAAEPTTRNQAIAEDEVADVAMASADFHSQLARDKWPAPMSA